MAYEPEPREWEDKEVLYEKYWGEMMSLAEIADEFDTGPRMISDQMEEFGIPKRHRCYKGKGQHSPFTGFYNDDESTVGDEDSMTHFDEEKSGDGSPAWQKLKQT